MINVKTAELIGPALDWAVGIAAGGEQKPYQFADNIDAPFWDAWVFPDGYACSRWSPSTDWAQGGPLIDKYAVKVEHFPGETIASKANARVAMNRTAYWQSGPTPLVALCRASVAAKLGEVVSVPAELIQQPTAEKGEGEQP